MERGLIRGARSRPVRPSTADEPHPRGRLIAPQIVEDRVHIVIETSSETFAY